jgi:FAD/FMN-containing dehydrogenase
MCALLGEGYRGILRMSHIVDALRSALGADAVLTGCSIGRRHMTDWTGFSPSQPKAVVFPRSTEDVSLVLKLCDAARQSIVPQGGMTGLSGGAIPSSEDLCVSLDRMSGVEEIDSPAATMSVWAGTPLQTVQDAAAAAGFDFPLDIAARSACQIGGLLATNAGGLRVVQSGTARDQVLGMEVVLAGGDVLTSMNKMLKNNTGYDWKHLFIGSEGTLGVITRAVLRLRPQPLNRCVALCALPDYAAVLALLNTLRTRLGGELSAFEIMWDDFFDFGVSASREKTHPFLRHYPLYALIEQSNSQTERDLEMILRDACVEEFSVAQTASGARALWSIREGTSDFPRLLDPINFDISLPTGEIGRFVEECRSLLRSRWPTHRSLFFGHIGDGNLHIAVDGRSLPDVSTHAVEEAVYPLVERYHGAVSAEHGIGLLKRQFLPLSRTEPEIRMMRAIKKTLDPNNILNPGKVFPIS